MRRSDGKALYDHIIATPAEVQAQRALDVECARVLGWPDGIPRATRRFYTVAMTDSHAAVPSRADVSASGSANYAGFPGRRRQLPWDY